MATYSIEEKHPTIICYGCAAHGLNLIFCDMIKLETGKNIAISRIAWWNEYCGRKELNKIACKILRLPATSAAVERLFSCYSYDHTAKRNRLSNERAAKVVFVSQNINLNSESYACCERPFLYTASPGSYASCSFHSADKVIEIESCDCSSDSYI